MTIRYASSLLVIAGLGCFACCPAQAGQSPASRSSQAPVAVKLAASTTILAQGTDPNAPAQDTDQMTPAPDTDPNAQPQDTDQNAPAQTTDQTAAPPAIDANAAAQALVDAHNAYRAKHCVPALTWSSQVAASAQQWANGCAFEHQGGTGLGENLAMGTNLSPKAAVDMWYAEVGSYNFAAPGFSMATGHFTQVVWRSTTQVGCGSATCQGQIFWVCRYSPPGNFTGQFPENVPQTCK